MGGNVSTTGNNNNIWNFNFNFNVNSGTQVDASQALQCFQNLPMFTDQLQRGSWRPQDVPGCGCIPSPRPDLSGAPAGRGLSTEVSGGWPQGTVTTAGGYRIVAEGNTNWSIYGPTQKPGETPNTRVWGDPHVNEKDGTRWDFTGTKGLDGQVGNDFVLGDGTRIFARTSSDQGHSVTTGLEIVNGTDHVSVGNVNGQPQLGAVQQDGYEWRAQHVALAGDRSTFHLRGDAENQHWLKETRGNVEGVVTGARDVNGSYQQNVDSTLRNVGLGADMRPPIGSRAWGNALRGSLDDGQANFWGQVGGRYGALPALQNAYGIHAGHINGEFRSDVRDLFGSWGSVFPNYGYGFNALSMFRELLMSDNDYQRSLQYGRNANLSWV